MNNLAQPKTRMSNVRWVVCTLLFFALTVNYLDRQVLSLTWQEFIAPEFHWTNTHYGLIAALFSLFYAASMLFAGRFIDWMGTKKGYMWAIGVWSLGACLHAFCGIATSGIAAGTWFVGFEGAKEVLATVSDVSKVINVSVVLFIIARLVLALGEGGSFPAAIKATAEYFPKKDRAFATSIFNAGSTVGALAAPLTIPFIAQAYGWEMTFIIIGALGFVWMGFWEFIYKKPENNPKVNKAELEYITQDAILDKQHEQEVENGDADKGKEKKLSFLQCFKFKQTWAFTIGKFMTDGVWWFYLFWAPAYLQSVYNMTSTQVAFPLFVLYMITLLAIVGGWLPSYFITKKGMNPYAGRMRAMLIFAFFPLLAMFAQPLGAYSYWFPVIIIGIAGAAHQAWSANIFTTVGDMFPKSAVGTVTGIGGAAGALASFIINMSSGVLFDYATETNMKFMGFEGIDSGYFVIFCICSVVYLLGWIIMKSLVPKYKVIEVK